MPPHAADSAPISGVPPPAMARLTDNGRFTRPTVIPDLRLARMSDRSGYRSCSGLGS